MSLSSSCIALHTKADPEIFRLKPAHSMTSPFASRLLYGITVFLGAFLLFLVEPMAAKQLLPSLGGSSAVWLTCLVFFQTVLLFGYLYAHWLTRSPATNWRMHLYLTLLATAVILLTIQIVHRPALTHGSNHPVRTIFAALTFTIGLPFLLLASTSPLLQVWLQRSEGGAIPYRLFALSNAGSLLALLAYPTLVEPNLTLKHQRELWSVGFMLYAMLCTLLARQAKRLAQPAAAQEPANMPGTTASSSSRWLWFLLPMAAAMQLCSVTSHLTINIAAIPLLWMLPLAVYLLTFIVAFEFPSLYRRGIAMRLLVVMLAALGYAISKTEVTLPIGIAILFFLAECFLACLFCHAEAYALRSQRASEATAFYFLIAAGGAAGTFFIGILSPLIFSANYDLAISFFVTAALAVAVTWRDGWAQRLLWCTCSVLLLVFAVMLHAAYTRQTLLEVRNFYGTLRVKQFANTQGDTERMLLNGAIQHGTQIFAPTLSRIPTTYYARDSGIGLALHLCCASNIGDDLMHARNIGVVGLGAGTIAAYGRSGDRIRFYEINPLVRPIAQNLFTYLRDSAAQITYADGDARTSLTAESPQHFDVLAIDAFSGDAIPLHLLTTQAIALYKKHLTPNGILAFHVSNQYLNLAPEIALLATSANMQYVLIDSPSDEPRGAYRSTWVLLVTNPSILTQPEIALLGQTIPTVSGLRTWTDDYSSLLPILRLNRH